MRIKNRNGEFPPGGWLFIDPLTSMKFTEGDFNSVVRLIIAHRRANPRLYPPEGFQFLNFESVAAELEIQTCSRLGGNPRFCETGEPLKLEPESGAVAVEMNKPCYQCGNATGFPIYCASCSGKRQTGWICEKCRVPMGKT